MKLSNLDLVLRGLLGILPTHLERYLRASLGDRCTPETLRALLAGNGSAPDLPDLADLSTQIRILTARGSDRRYLLPLPPGLVSKLHEVRRFRNEAVHGQRFDADRTLAALVAVSETLRLIGSSRGQGEIRELIGAIDDGRGLGGDPLGAIGVEVECVPVISYAHAVAGAAPVISVGLFLSGHGGALPDPRAAADGQQRRVLTSPARGARESQPGILDVTLTVIEDDGGSEVVEPWRLSWDTTRPTLTGTRALTLNRANLLQVEQSCSAHVRVELHGQDGTMAVRRIPGLTVLPPRQWRLAGGERWAGAALATFVQPDQAAVGALAAEALDVAADGRSPRAAADDSDALAAAACAVLRRHRVTIEAAGGPWSSSPHLIRTAAGLLEARAGSTLDVAALIAGVLERLDTATTLLLTPEAAFLGYRRDRGSGAGRPPASPQEAADLVRRGVMGLIDPDLSAPLSAAVLHELTGPARSVALGTLSDLALVAPIGSSRADGAPPQPMLERDEDDVVVELPPPTRPVASEDGGPAPGSSSAVVDAGGSPADGAPASAPEAAAVEGLPAPPAVEEWKRNLLDLSRRNPLISRPSRDVVELLVQPELIGRLEDLVNAGDLVTLRPVPHDAAGSEDRAALLTEQRTVHVDLSTREKYKQRLRAMTVSARTTLKETGANNLYLTVGALAWRIDGYRVRSPLILIPVRLRQEGETYGIVLDEDGISTPNHSLLTRFRADTGMDLAELAEPVRDEHGIDIEATLERLRRRLRESGRRDVVEPTVHLGMFRFSTYRMWQDLETDWPTIVSNPVVGHLLEAPGAAFADPAGGGPAEDAAGAAGADIDEVVENLPLDADSDQARVIADAAAGLSLVVKGPPGTGKSQTVANLIFRALSTGRTVMFVAEKLSTLDVVARRLREEAGIGDLLLNLHDNDMKPVDVCRALRRALDLRAPAPGADPDALRRELAALRARLDAYREGLHDPRQGSSPSSYYRARQALIEARDAGGVEGAGMADGVAGPESAEWERARAAFEDRARATGLDSFDPAVHAQLLDDYRRTQERLREALTPELLDVVLDRRETALREAGPRAEALRREIARRKGTLNIRDLIDLYGDLVVAITPCLLVSPDSVARFFPAHRRYVDVVVFDEASQITVAGAVGAMGRGRSVVVVGDPEQMPPTAAPGAARSGGEPGSAGRGENESILDRCLAGGVPSRALTWHYRSRVESLIAFSNRHYYGGRLLSFPSPRAMAPRSDDGPDGHGISLRRVDGTYIRPESRVKNPSIRPNTNPAEARKIVEEVVRRFEASPGRTPSVGIITFNARQRDLIESWLRKELGSDRVAEALEARDGLFVRNLENAQGEERDTILFSLTFSANERGDVPLSFGSLGHAGGERRLNVAITRARRQIVVFASFDPEDLHAERSSHQGLKDLRAYLEQARAGGAPPALPVSGSAVDLHRNEIAERLRDAGLDVHVGVGHSSFEIDLALALPQGSGSADQSGPAGRPEVSEAPEQSGPVGRPGSQEDPGRPGRPGVAVLLDGPGWDRRGSTSDRDLLPVDVLGTMGWERVERVWMPEWVADAQAVVARLVEAAGGTYSSQEPREPAVESPVQDPPAAASQEPREPAVRGPEESGADAAGPAGSAADGTASGVVGPAGGGAGSDVAQGEPGADADGAESPDGAEGSVVPAGPAVLIGPADYRQWQPGGVLPKEILDRAATGDEEARARVVEVARTICDVESPIIRHRLIVKICRAFGVSRTTQSRARKVGEILGEAFAYIDRVGERDFVWRNMDAMRVAPPYRRKALDYVDSIEDIHPRELVALMRDVRASSPEWSSAEELCEKALKRLSARKRKLSARGVLPALEAALKEAEREDR